MAKKVSYQAKPHNGAGDTRKQPCPICKKWTWQVLIDNCLIPGIHDYHWKCKKCGHTYPAN